MITSPSLAEELLKEEIRQLRLSSAELRDKLSSYQEAVRIQYALDQHAIVTITTTEGVITYVNSKFCELSGYVPSELLGKTHRVVSSDHHPPAFFAQMYQTITAGQTWKGQLRNRAKDGSYFWVDMVITPVLDAAGLPEQYIAICTDTTRYKVAQAQIEELLAEAHDKNEEMKASEEELRQTLEHSIEVNERITESEAKYRLVSESMQDLICLHSLEGHYTYISQSVHSLLGYEAAELMGINPLELIHPQDSRRLINQVRRCKEEGRASDYLEFRIRNKAGEYLWFETLIQPIKDYLERVTSLHTASRNITKRKKAEGERDNFFNHSLDLMVVATLEGRILRVNNSWSTTLGFAEEELERSRILDFIHPKDLEATAALVNNHLQQGKTGIAFENRYRCKDNSYKWLSWNYVPFLAEGVMYGFARDITERKLAEEALKNTLEELRERNHEMDNYVYRVSHDLRAPLCSIRGLTNLIELEEDLATVKTLNGMIEDRINKSDEFIHSVLSHSKMVNADLAIAPIDFEKIISNCFEELKYAANADQLQKWVQVQQKAPFCSDPLRIMTILKNFASNAIKYLNPLAERSFVKFNIEITEYEAVVRIEDNGIGIDPKYIAKIFDMFYRATEKSDGNGLGLYIVKQTIERIGGHISVASIPDQGTTFTITLPNLKNELD